MGSPERRHGRAAGDSLDRHAKPLLHGLPRHPVLHRRAGLTPGFGDASLIGYLFH